MTTHRVGFACKINHKPGIADPSLNIKSTTVTWLTSATQQAASAKLEQLVKYNLDVLYRQVKWVGKLPNNQRMFRISSDMLPCYTHQVAAQFYQSKTTQQVLELGFQKVGDLARELDVRLSFHPGQFCVLASENPQVVINSIQEFEYHASMIRWMGYGQLFQDFKCNVHIGGKLGPQGIIAALQKLSPEARNTITIENAEFSWHLEHSLQLAAHCALVLDVHHHWIATGEWIEPNDSRIEQVIESWRGVRPTMHLSCSREEHILDHQDPDMLPDLDDLMQLGFTRQKLRAHSDFYWNNAINSWAKTHLVWADIMLESKEKNLAQQEFIK